MSKKCRAYSESKLGLEPADNRKAFYAGWDAAIRYVLTNDISQERVDETAKREHEWVGLTDEEIRKIEYSDDNVEYELFDEGEYGYEINIYPREFARAIEARLKEKNT